MSLAKLLLRPRWLVIALIGFIMVGSSDHHRPPPALAADWVDILTQNVFCEEFLVEYYVGDVDGIGDPLFPDVAYITVYNGTTAVASSTSGTVAPNRDNFATIPINPPQPEGTLLHVGVTIDNGNGQVVSSVGGAQPCRCSNPNGCGGTVGGGTAVTNQSIPWNGYSDGRLNPDMAEDYSIYCENDLIRVLRANPPPTVTLTEFALIDVINLDPTVGEIYQDDVTLIRQNDDVSVWGFNGNRAPNYGSKRFSLNECINHNGGTPVVVNTPPTITVDSRSLFFPLSRDFISLTFTVNDADHDDLTLSFRSADPTIVFPSSDGVFRTNSFLLVWDEATQSYVTLPRSNLYIVQGNEFESDNGQATSIILTITDSHGAQSTTTVSIFAEGRISSFIGDAWYRACGAIPLGSAIVVPSFAILYTKRRRKLSL